MTMMEQDRTTSRVSRFLVWFNAVALLAVATGVSAQVRTESVAGVMNRLEPEIRAIMQEHQIPSLTIALVDRERILYTGAFGESNVWARTPARVETVYLIGSTFKAQSTIALLQQMEQGKFDLDDPVNDYLPPELHIRGEEAARPVTFRHLLTHTSGLPGAFGPHPLWGETLPLPLEQYLADSLRLATPPLQRVVYSNLAYTLIAYLVERFSGVPYRDYIRDHVWLPLGMTSTAFAPTATMEERLAVPYILTDGRLTPTPRLRANVWPAGIVYGTITDQARWVRFNLGDGTASDSVRLLKRETLDAMHTLQYPQFAGEPMGGGWGYESPGYGLTWWVSTREGEHFFAHSGSVPGYTAFVAGNRDRGIGVALLSNGNRAHEHLVRITNRALELLGEVLVANGGNP